MVQEAMFGTYARTGRVSRVAANLPKVTGRPLQLQHGFNPWAQRFYSAEIFTKLGRCCLPERPSSRIAPKHLVTPARHCLLLGGGPLSRAAHMAQDDRHIQSRSAFTAHVRMG